MSMAISRASYTGDPGLWDIFKKVGRAIPGPIGMAFDVFGGGGGKVPGRPTAGPGSFPLGPTMGTDLMRGPAPGSMVAANGCPAPMSGYHLNKSDYFLKSGEYVPEGSRYVRNRKRNPANARATSRAISRVVGAKRYAQSLSRISVRKKKK